MIWVTIYLIKKYSTTKAGLLHWYSIRTKIEKFQSSFFRLELQHRLRGLRDDQLPPLHSIQRRRGPDVRPSTHDQLCLHSEPRKGRFYPGNEIRLLIKIENVRFYSVNAICILMNIESYPVFLGHCDSSINNNSWCILIFKFLNVMEWYLLVTGNCRCKLKVEYINYI